MGGKGEVNEAVRIKATQDQLRLARITQDTSSIEEEKMNIQKLIKKVTETTQCTTGQAETALYDADYNVEVAVNAILEQSYPDENVWTEQKSRKTRRAEAEERAEAEQLANQRSRNYTARAQNSYSGRGRGTERSRGGYRGGRGSGARGGPSSRGAYLQPPSGNHAGSTNAFAGSHWDNSMALKAETVKEWTNNTTSVVDDIPEDTDWKTAGTLVFSRRDEPTTPKASSPTTIVTPSAMVTGSSATAASSSLSTTGPISFAAVAAAGTKVRRDNSSVRTTLANAPSLVGSGATRMTNSPLSQQAVSSSVTNVTGQSVQNTSSLYNNSSGLSPSSVIISGNMEKSTSEGLSSSSPSIAGASGTACMQPCPSPATAQVQQSSPSAAQSQPQPSGGTSAADWTTQLKNDLRIGSNSGGVASVPTTSQSSTLTQVLTAPQPRSISSSISPQQQGATKSNMIVSNSQASAAVATTPTANHMTSSQVSHTVEFVSGDSNNSTSLPEYQFGFHVDSAATNTEDSVDTAYSSNVQNHAISSQQTKSEAELSVPVSSSTVTNGPVGDYSNTAQQQSKSTVTNGTTGMSTMSTASHMSAMGHQRTSQSSSLSYADTSIMSYPSPESRVTVSKGAAITTLHHQQQQQAHQLYTTTQIPYNSYGYLNMNMYSPVASVRQDDAQYAAALLQYPFGMGQIDMSSLSTVLPPPALASQGQPNQPPPPIQNQHQQRPDQHTSYVDFKAYAAATGVASNTAGGVTGASLLGSQQGRETSAMGNSTVAPPPGFSGPPSNMPATAFTLPQPNHMSSIFPVPPTYPQLNQLPLSFMLPHVAGNSQHKIGQHIFQQQAMDESSLPDQRHSAQQQKSYSGSHQQIDKYSASGNSAKDRLGGGAQATPPPQMYQQQPPQGYLSQQIPLHSKKAYGNGTQHWGTS